MAAQVVNGSRSTAHASSFGPAGHSISASSDPAAIVADARTSARASVTLSSATSSTSSARDVGVGRPRSCGPRTVAGFQRPSGRRRRGGLTGGPDSTVIAQRSPARDAGGRCDTAGGFGIGLVASARPITSSAQSTRRSIASSPTTAGRSRSRCTAARGPPRSFRGARIRLARAAARRSPAAVSGRIGRAGGCFVSSAAGGTPGGSSITPRTVRSFTGRSSLPAGSRP